MKKIKNILFDLDGTIIEPQKGIINSILYSLDKMGITEYDVQELKSFIGPPLMQSFIDRYGLNPEEGTLAVEYYREYYSKTGIYENCLYDYIEGLFKVLKEKGCRLFVATSKPTFFAKIILEYHKLDRFFENIVGSNLDNTRTDKSEIIEFILKEHNLSYLETLMVGDRKYDIIGAKNNSILSIGVTYGHGSQEEFTMSSPDFIVDSCKEIELLLTGGN